jgi:hypothetical protein
MKPGRAIECDSRKANNSDSSYKRLGEGPYSSAVDGEARRVAHLHSKPRKHRVLQWFSRGLSSCRLDSECRSPFPFKQDTGES